jgi:hypothetical protein
MKILWMVKIYDKGKEFRVETFETRGKAAAYAMRWNKQADQRWRAEVIRKEIA